MKLDTCDPALERSENDFEAGSPRPGWRDKGEVHRAGSGDSPGHA